MIDIHTHILPGIDDGPQTMEESLRIAMKATEAGVKTVIATPHVLEMPSEKDWKIIKNTFNMLKQALISKEIDIEIMLGAELFISPDLPRKIKENRELTINQGNRYALLELPVQEIPPFTDQTIFELILQGIVPILAHPERYLEIQKDTKKLSKMIQKGVMCQVNAGSLLGRYGKKVQRTAKKLLANNTIHIISSDVHSIPNGHYPLSQGVKIAAKVIGIKRAKEMITSTPGKVIQCERIKPFPE